MAPRPPRLKVPGSKPGPTANQKRKPRKPKVVSAAERVVKYIGDMNPFD